MTNVSGGDLSPQASRETSPAGRAPEDGAPELSDAIGTSPTGAFRTACWQRLLAEPATYELTRFWILRLLAFVYFAAFASLYAHLDPLIGSHGLLPARQFLLAARGQLGTAATWRLPTLFWLGASDGAMHAFCGLGLALSVLALFGLSSALLQLILWLVYMSFVHVGQVFFGYGWELQLLETGFLAIFLCPLRSARMLPASPTPKVVIWLFRWLVFRVMVGAALIKLRGDECWRDLTCLDFHFETQPNPNPFAWWLHRGPHWMHAIGVALNHFVELVVPWFAFGFRRWRHTAGALLVAFQGILIASGNLSFLNWLTIVPALACFDDSVWARLLPARRRQAVLARIEALMPNRLHARVCQGLGVLVALLSVLPILNLASGEQRMNASFDPLALVNTYGAFGSVDRERYEVVLEGTRDVLADERARWEEYELPCMPGDPHRRPCLVSPYHYRLDWQMWFVGNDAARGEAFGREPWLVHLVWQLLRGDPSPRPLFARDPFATSPPRWIRADIWRYVFARTREAGGPWWNRERVAEFLRPVSIHDAALRAYVASFGW
jgi:hypothetical protein